MNYCLSAIQTTSNAVFSLVTLCEVGKGRGTQIKSLFIPREKKKVVALTAVYSTQARSHVVFQRPHLSGFGLDMASTAVSRQPSHCRNPLDETGARVFWLLSYSVLYVIPLPQTHKHTKALARGGEEGEGAGRGLEFYQNSICRDASKTGLTLSMSVARGQAWGRGENTSWPGKGGPLRAGLDQGCVCG